MCYWNWLRLRRRFGCWARIWFRRRGGDSLQVSAETPASQASVCFADVQPGPICICADLLNNLIEQNSANLVISQACPRADFQRGDDDPKFFADGHGFGRWGFSKSKSLTESGQVAIEIIQVNIFTFHTVNAPVSFVCELPERPFRPWFWDKRFGYAIIRDPQWILLEIIQRCGRDAGR